MKDVKVINIGCTGRGLMISIMLLMILKFTLIPNLSWFLVLLPFWLPILLIAIALFFFMLLSTFFR